MTGSAAELNMHASSTGQTMTAASWLDVHFESCRREYEQQVRAVGIQPGWRVLDAGCGGGNFLPWLADLVGPTGQVAAFDLAPDNIAVVQARLVDWRLATAVEPQVGSILALPYPDDAFDAVWCANVTQYLTDAEMDIALSELCRVVRPGGLVAVKNNDQSLVRILPAAPGMNLRRALARDQALGIQATHRASTLPAWLRRAGLINIRRLTTLIEYSAPLEPLARQLIRETFAYWAQAAAALDLSAEDHAFWASLGDPAQLDQCIDDPDFYTCEGNTLAVGAVPV